MKVLFIDRDGTLIHEPPDEYINSIEKLGILPHVIESLQKLQSYGYTLVMISNQPGLGTNKFPQDFFEAPQNTLMQTFKENDILFKKTFFCPHFREDKCKCMKPQTGLIDRFLKNNDIQLEKSYVIGDRETDVQLAKNIGCKSVYYSDKPHADASFNSKYWNKICDYILK